MALYEVALFGTVSYAEADNAGKAKAMVVASARDAGYPDGFREVRARRVDELPADYRFIVYGREDQSHLVTTTEEPGEGEGE